MKRIINAFCGKPNSGKWASILVLCAGMAIAAPVQTFTTLLSHDATDGESPQGRSSRAPMATSMGRQPGAGLTGGGRFSGSWR